MLTTLEELKSEFRSICKANKLRKVEVHCLAEMLRRGLTISNYTHINENTMLILVTPSKAKNNRLIAPRQYASNVYSWAINSSFAINVFNHFASLPISTKTANEFGYFLFNEV